MATTEDLFASLRKHESRSAAELLADLGVSKPTLSRLVKAAGERVCRMGKARATRYALTRSLADLGSRLPIYRVTESGRVEREGTLIVLAARDRYWLELASGVGELFAGLPPFAWDMSPQGYLGRSFSQRFPELGLPRSISDWNDDHRSIALARRGEDCVGDLILGTESLDRFLASVTKPVRRADYPELAVASLSGQPGSSAGGEQPKFTAYRAGKHVLVKFASGEGAAGERWRDLLVCESIALRSIGEVGIDASVANWYDVAASRFLEVERFDRVGERGRKGAISLAALDNQFYGFRDSWTKAAQRMASEPCAAIDPDDLRKMRWLDAFGALIGNTDRHFGNLTFRIVSARPLTLRLAPVYDMLPMIFAPVGANVVERTFVPGSPTAANLDVWPEAARRALEYWEEVANLGDLSRAFRELCARCRETLAECVRRCPD